MSITLSMIHDKLSHNSLLTDMVSIRDVCWVINEYTRPHRVYHNVDHLSSLLENIDLVNWQNETKEILQIIALYHDAVYNPTTHENELQSANLFYNAASGKLDKIKKIIYHAILDTAYGKSITNQRSDMIIHDKKTYNKSTRISTIFRELDYGPLFTSSLTDLMVNENKIMKEYQCFDYKSYKEGRLKFLIGAVATQNGLNDDQVDRFQEYIRYVRNRQPRIAIYAGSFNPFHLGHLNVLEQAEKQFDKVIILSAINKSKNPNINEDQIKRLNQTLPYHQIVLWDHLLSDYIGDFIKVYNFKPTLIRGLRTGYDVEYEINLKKFLKDALHSDLQIQYYLSDANVQHISSSAIRELESFGPGKSELYKVTKYNY